MNNTKYIIYGVVTSLFLAGATGFAQTNKEKAVWAIAEIQEAVSNLQKDLTDKCSEALFIVKDLKPGEDLSEEQLRQVKTIVNTIKVSLFNIPTCVSVSNYKQMEKDDFKKGKALAEKSK